MQLTMVGHGQLPANLFNWQGPDGSLVLTARPPRYNNSSGSIDAAIAASLDWWPKAAGGGREFRSH